MATIIKATTELRHASASDVRAAAKVCLLGTTVANALFEGQDPVGQTVRIKNFPFRVIGVAIENPLRFRDRRRRIARKEKRSPEFEPGFRIVGFVPQNCFEVANRLRAVARLLGKLRQSH